MEASETAQRPDAAPAEGQPQETQQQPEPSPDVLEQINTLTQRVNQIAPQDQPQPQGDTDLATALIGDQPEPEGEPEFEGFDPTGGLYDPTGQDDFQSPQELEAYLQERDDRLTNLEAQYAQEAEDRNLAALDALTEKYPQLKDESHVAKVAAVLQPLAEARGDESLVLDPRLVEAVHKSLMFDEASSREVPAEEAAAQGATLETDAGVRQDVQDPSYSEQQQEKILNAGRRKSTFT